MADLRSPGAMAYAAAAVAAGYAVVRVGALHGVEERLGSLLRRPLGDRVDRRIAIGTDLGSLYALAGAAATLAVLGHRRRGLDVAAAGTLAWTTTQAMKPLANRQRPYESHGAHRMVSVPAGSSWPSAHSAVMAATAATLSEGVRPAGRTVLATLADLVALSRIHVGVHHPSDVVAGWGVGVLTAAAWRVLRHPVRALARRRRGSG